MALSRLVNPLAPKIGQDTPRESENMKRLIFWSLCQALFAALLVSVGLTIAGTWIFLREPGGYDMQQSRATQVLRSENIGLKAALIDADGRMSDMRTQIAARQLRADQAAKVARDLDDLGSGLNRFTTSSEQLAANEERMARMKQMEADSRKRVLELEQSLIRTQWEKDGLEIALEKSREKLTAAQEAQSPFVYYVRRAWESSGKIVLIAAGIVMLGLPVWRMFRATSRPDGPKRVRRVAEGD